VKETDVTNVRGHLKGSCSVRNARLEPCYSAARLAPKDER
jgi:hypothetical protein